MVAPGELEVPVPLGVRVALGEASHSKSGRFFRTSASWSTAGPAVLAGPAAPVEMAQPVGRVETVRVGPEGRTAGTAVTEATAARVAPAVQEEQEGRLP